MIWKVLVFIFILVLVYLVFFRKKRITNNGTSNKKDEIADTLIECQTCGVYITKDESILSNGKYFCSKECMNK